MNYERSGIEISRLTDSQRRLLHTRKYLNIRPTNVAITTTTTTITSTIHSTYQLYFYLPTV